LVTVYVVLISRRANQHYVSIIATQYVVPCLSIEWNIILEIFQAHKRVHASDLTNYFRFSQYKNPLLKQ